MQTTMTMKYSFGESWNKICKSTLKARCKHASDLRDPRRKYQTSLFIEQLIFDCTYLAKAAHQRTNHETKKIQFNLKR